MASRAFRIGKAFGKKGVLGKASLDTPEAVGATEIADSAEVLGTADAGVSKFSTNDKKLFVPTYFLSYIIFLGLLTKIKCSICTYISTRHFRV